MSDSSSGVSSPDVGAVIVAAGSGSRMGGPAGVRKQYLELAGEPILLRALRPFLAHPEVSATVLVLPPEDARTPPPWMAKLPVLRVAGGTERGDSVWNGLSALPAGVSTVLIHDGARPLVSAAVIGRVLAAARAGPAIPVVPVADTVKEVDDRGEVVATPDRRRLRLAQTPQGFPRELIVQAYRRARTEGWAATDDAALCERLGIPVRTVEGDPSNLKVTRPGDLAVAAALARGDDAR